MIRDVDAERWRRAGTVFHELVDLDETSRSERLMQLGNSDPELRTAVEALLAGDAAADDALPAPGFGLGALSKQGLAIDERTIEGMTIGRFRIREQIAWGGMGVVYRADDTELHRSVALKFPLLDTSVSESSRALTLREARAAGALDHSNLCPIYDVGESDVGPFFVMPLYRGETLKERIARATVDIGEALAILEQLAAGLSCAHDAGIVHCDIKPGNIMLLPDGTVKLLDFGLARAVAAESPGTSSLVGTIHYMSPEQIRNEPVDARADLWALGVILYEMLAVSRPFVGDSSDAIIDAVLESEPPRLGSTISPAARALVSGLLAKEPERRLQRASDVTRAIAVARLELEPPTFRRRRRRRSAVALGALVGIGILAAALWIRTPTTLVSSGKLAPHDTLVLADVEVAGLDPSTSPALTTFVRQEFADSKGVALMSTSDLRSALERMRQRPGARITPELAREIGLRERLRAILRGSVSQLPAGYLVTLRLIESETGNELASTTSTAVNAERDLLPALSRASRELRHRIGESTRRATRASSPERKPLTTTSLEAARLLWARQIPPPPVPERIATARKSIRLDSAFAYAWMSVGTMLSWTHYRSAALDSAFTMAYRFRENVTLMERAQVSSTYWLYVQRDRRSSQAELESALKLDTTIYRVVPLNLAEVLIETRQFERAELFARRIEHWKTVGSAVASALVRAQVAQGKYASAESTITRLRPSIKAIDPGAAALRRVILLNTLRFDSAEVLLAQMPEQDAAAEWPAHYRLRDRIGDGHRFEARVDSSTAAVAAAAGARFDPSPGRALALAREALWLDNAPAAAAVNLDKHWRGTPAIHDIQDRIEGAEAAALYAAAGRVAKARELLDIVDSGADTIAKRATYEYRQGALAEIALAEGKFTEAMRLFRASDFAADGLPTSACAVCILPSLARVSERAGWTDSAQVFWNAYVTQPSIERLRTDQWFLLRAYRRLAALATARGDARSATLYRGKLAALR